MPITDKNSQKFTVSECWPAIGLLAAFLAGIAIMTVTPGNAESAYAVITPPWSNAARTIAIIDAAGGSIVGTGGFADVIVARPANPAFLDALRNAGAWLVLSSASADLCSNESLPAGDRT